jgi:HNH endonuclease
MKYLEEFAYQNGAAGVLAYHDPRWRRDKAPLLDHLGAVIDHVEAFASGGAHDDGNFVTSCNKCNMRKSAGSAQKFSTRSPLLPVKGKYGEPANWDGLSALFMLLAERSLQAVVRSEREWLIALKAVQ